MASKRKIKVQKFRVSRKRKIKEARKADHQAANEKKQRQRAFRKEIKDALGFDQILSKLKPQIPDGFGPNGRVLDWNNVEM